MGVHVMDVTNASRTQLMDLATCEWDEDIAACSSTSRAPACRGSCPPRRYMARLPAPLHGMKLAGILGDQQAALVGQTCFAPGEAKNTYGTGSFLLMNTGTEPVQSKAGLLTTLAYQFGNEPPHYALEGAIAITGALVQWLRDNLKLFDVATQIEPLAQREDNGDVYIVPAFSGLYAPYWGMTRAA